MIKVILFLLTIQCIASESKKDEFGPRPFEYKGVFWELVPGEYYSLRGIVVPLESPVHFFDSNGRYVKTNRGFQIDLREHPMLGRRYIKKLNQSTIYPIYDSANETFKPFTYARARIKVISDIEICKKHCEGLQGIYKMQNILIGNITKVPFAQEFLGN